MHLLVWTQVYYQCSQCTLYVSDTSLLFETTASERPNWGHISHGEMGGRIVWLSTYRAIICTPRACFTFFYTLSVSKQQRRPFDSGRQSRRYAQIWCKLGLIVGNPRLYHVHTRKYRERWKNMHKIASSNVWQMAANLQGGGQVNEF